MLNIFLIRHGQTEWNKQEKMQGSKNSELTSYGLNQANLLHNRFQDIKIDRVYASPIDRAMITAKTIFPNHDIKIANELREISMGYWEGRNYSDIENEYPQQWYNFFNDPFKYIPTLNGESFSELEYRIKKFLKNEDIQELSGNIAIVSHKLTIKMMLSVLLNDKNVFTETDISPSSVSKITFNNNAFVVEYVNHEERH